MTRTTRVTPPGLLFVCLGNVCRSPMAEVVAGRMLAENWPDRQLRIASRGTAAFNAGKPADARALAALRAAGYTPPPHVAQQISDEDFAAFGQIIAMDRANLHTLSGWAPAGFQGRIRLLASRAGANIEVPDPFHADDSAFTEVLRLIESGTRALLQELLGPPG